MMTSDRLGLIVARLGPDHPAGTAASYSVIKKAGRGGALGHPKLRKLGSTHMNLGPVRREAST